MKNQPGTLKKPKELTWTGTMKKQPGTLKNQHGIKKNDLEP